MFEYSFLQRENPCRPGVSCQFTSAPTAPGHCLPLRFGVLAASDPRG